MILDLTRSLAVAVNNSQQRVTDTFGHLMVLIIQNINFNTQFSNNIARQYTATT